eukprot:ANDGO_07326.mRNA.1 hypothetical protein
MPALNSRSTLFLGWLILAGLGVAYAISAFVAASVDDVDSSRLRFWWVWSAIVTLLYTAAVPVIYSRFLTAYSFGILAGFALAWSQTMLITAVVTGWVADNITDEGSLVATTVFASILFPALLGYFFLQTSLKDHVLDGVPAYKIATKNVSQPSTLPTTMGPTTTANTMPAGELGTVGSRV